MCKTDCLRLLIAGLLVSPSVWSQSSSLDAHVHGEAELTIAIEGEHIEMQLLSPAANILGFEHAPSNDEQREQIHLAEDILENANALFAFRGAECSSTSASIEMPYEAHDDEHDEHHDEHDEHSDGHSEHEEGHAEHDSHDEHGHDENHEDEHDEHEGHSEVVANYVFECDSDGVTHIQVALLNEFPAIEDLDAQWITAAKQGAQELSADNQWIDLR